MNSSLSILLRWRPHRILSKMITTQTLNTFQVPIINKLMKTTNIPSADLKDLFNFLHGNLGRETSTYNTLAPVLHRLTHLKTIETFISDLQSIGFLNNSDDSKTNLLSLFSSAGNAYMLIDAYHHMVESHGYVPNTFALNLLVDSLFTTSQPLVAVSVLEQMNSPDSFTFELLLSHISNLKDITSLLLTSSFFLKHMLSVPNYLNKVTFNKILISICKMEDVTPQVLYHLLGLKVKLGLKFSMDGWASIIPKFCELGRLEDATKLFFDMMQTGYVVSVAYTVLFKAVIESNKVDDALHLYNTMLSKGFMPDKDSFKNVVTAICAEGRMEEAVRAYRDILKYLPLSDSHLDNHITLVMITGLINAGMTEEASNVLSLSRIPRVLEEVIPLSTKIRRCYKRLSRQ